MTNRCPVEREPVTHFSFRMLSFELSREPFIDRSIQNRRAESKERLIRTKGSFVGKQAIRIRSCRASTEMKRLKTGLFCPTNHLRE